MAAFVNASIVEHVQTLQDPRMERTKKHPLLAILVSAVCTLWTGGEGCQAMALLGQSKRAWLQTCLALPPGIPSHAPFGRVFARLTPQRLPACCCSWTQAVAQLPPGALVSLEGKTVRASFDRATASCPLPMLSAWCAEQGGLVRGQSTTAAQSHELTAMPDLRQLLALQGCLVTMDAMGGQTASAEPIRDPGGDSLWALQSHHKTA
jgi:DDE_Tnp_1-associated